MITLMEKRLKEEKRKADEKEQREARQAEQSEKIRVRFQALRITKPGVAVPTNPSPVSTLSSEKQKGRPLEESELVGERSRKRVKYSADDTRSTRPDISTSCSRSSSSPRWLPSGSDVGRPSRYLSNVPSERSKSPLDTSEQGSSTRPDSGPDFIGLSGAEDEAGETRENMESVEEGPGPVEIAVGDDDEDEGEDEVEAEEEQEMMAARKDGTPQRMNAMILDSQGDVEVSMQKRVWCLMDGVIPPPDIPADPVPDPKKMYQRAMVQGLLNMELLVEQLDDQNPTTEKLQKAVALIRSAAIHFKQILTGTSTAGDCSFFPFFSRHSRWVTERDDNQMQED
jgi:hypothetical protein